eukprot:CAMPEP_0118933696 /NCGR_PEP_ID=MMETSP1169-20130426/12185_1 /TAXON_ID=36882 /ORGANISM="Pyramimonas obovata, Strain CCMP722" /LENGTH=72 /DNA_ID=CAMNT_0006876493 /DNA_START=60 /DNA_END=278 /DNA_ORIENTATION=-
MPQSLQSGIAAIRASQKVVQEAQKSTGFVHLIGSTDKITSVAVPGLLVAVATAIFADGAGKMYFGYGKKEDF